MRCGWSCAFALVLALGAAGCAGPPPEPATPLRVQVLAINDFHGHLEPPRGGIRLADPARPGERAAVPAGGAAYLASALAEARARHPHHVFVAAGDLIGASPLVSALARDEPTIEVLSALGLVASAVGNHEFDRGAAELLRLQRLAGFQYLAASTFDAATGRTILPPYLIRRFDGVPVAFIGLTLKDTPNIVMASGVAGLRFADEAETVNALVPQLQAQGVQAIVLLLHEGGWPAALGQPDGCDGLSGPVVPIVRRLHPAIDVVISGHTHRAYVCRIDGRLVTSAEQYGTVLSEIELEIDRASGDVAAAHARNTVVRHDRFAAEPAIAARVAAAVERARPLAQRIVAPLAAPLAREPGPAGESALGRLVADAQLAATRDVRAQIALMNPGGLRADLLPGPDGQVRYEDLFSAQPFYNNLVTLTLSGAQLARLLEQQWQGQPRPRILQVSRGFGYAWDGRRPVGARIVPGSLALDGRPIAPDASLRITVNSFLAGGGDNFAVLTEGAERRTGPMDIDALEAHLAAGGRVDDAPRIRRVD